MNRDDRWLKSTVRILLLALGVYDLMVLGGVFDFLSIYVPIVTHRGLNVALLLLLTFLIMPAKEDSRKIFWYDFVLIIAAVVPTLYLAVLPDRIMAVTEDPDLVTKVEMILFLGLVVSVLEAGRRSGGLALLICALFFFSAVFLGDYYPGPFYARTMSFSSVTSNMYLSLGSNSLLGMVVDIGTTILVAFMLFGGFLETSGAGEFFINLGLSAAGKYRGGPAKVAILASGLMGMISGSGVANTVTVGPLTIPMMKKVGFKPHFAAAVEAVASNGGQIMPPVMGAVAFLIAQMLGISYWDVCIAAALPALLYYLSLFFMIDFEAAKQGLKGKPREELPVLSQTLKEGWYYFLPIIILVVLIAQGTFAVYRSCIFSMIVLVILNLLFGKSKRFTLAKVAEAITKGLGGMVFISGSLFVAGIIIASIQMTGIGINFTRLLTQLAGQSVLGMLLLAALASFVLGIGMSSVPCYIICALLIGPPLEAAGIDPIASHLFFFYWGILSFITPPVAEAALASSAIAGASFWKTGWTAMALGVVSYVVPFFFIYQPALLLKGPLNEVILSALLAIFGCYILSSGVIGYFLKPIPFWMRILPFTGGLLLIYPGWKSGVAGMTLFGIVVVQQLLSLRSERVAHLKYQPMPKIDAR